MPLISTQTLTPVFTFSLPGKIWKIKVDPVSQNLVLEVRQPEKRQTSFWVIAPDSGKIELANFQPNEPWWTGLEDACGGYLLLHQFEKNWQTGRHLGIQAVQENSGKIAWQQAEFTFKGLLSANKILAENQVGQLLEVAMATGKPEFYAGTQAEAHNLRQQFENKRKSDLRFPVPYLPEDEHFKLLQQFIESRTGMQAIQTIEYLETEKNIVLSFYAQTTSVLANFLLVCALSGEVVLQVCLEPQAAGLGSDTFFIFAEKLFFIQEKSVIAAYLL